MKTRTFTAIDGRKVRVQMTEEQVADRELVTLAAIWMPILMILVFTVIGGLA